MVHYVAEVIEMPKRIERDKEYNDKLRKIGMLFQKKRWSISNGSRESFIEDRNELIFNTDDENADWISLRYLINIETGKNLPSIEMLIKLSIALEVDPVELFNDIYKILYDKE
ncbi:MAG: helix-turn-helix domain-containing protein [Oscillospiraceae bacterium]|nr:helix-turn-helix domain-containing protein [Oscillospiraceae bacterium]